MTNVSTLTSSNAISISGTSLHLRYGMSIGERLFTSLKLSYFNLKGESTNETPAFFNNTQTDLKRVENFTLNEIRLSPSILLLIGKHFGCHLDITGLNFLFNDSRKTDKTTDYNLNFNPSGWNIGFFYYIPTGKVVD